MDERLYQPLSQNEVLGLFAFAVLMLVAAAIFAYERRMALRNKEDDERLEREVADWKKLNDPKRRQGKGE